MDSSHRFHASAIITMNDFNIVFKIDFIEQAAPGLKIITDRFRNSKQQFVRVVRFPYQLAYFREQNKPLFCLFADCIVAEHNDQSIDLSVIPERRRTINHIEERAVFANKSIFLAYQLVSMM